MQWKYDRQTKEYIISFGIVPLLIITGIILNVFYNAYW
ncbi:CpsH domain protein [Bacillus cereus Rock4-18]|nr:CpsH domain protein [Bacillus cereus Rock4-18]